MVRRTTSAGARTLCNATADAQLPGAGFCRPLRIEGQRPVAALPSWRAFEVESSGPVNLAEIAAALASARERLYGVADPEDDQAVALAVADLDPGIVEQARGIHLSLYTRLKALPADAPADVREAVSVAEADAEFVRRFVDPGWVGVEYVEPARAGSPRGTSAPRRVAHGRARTRRSRRRSATARRGQPREEDDPDLDGRAAGATAAALEQLVLDLEAATDPDAAWRAFCAYRDSRMADRPYDPSRAPLPW